MSATVTLADALAASVPFVGETLIQLWVWARVQLTALRLALLNT
jgi:hypothetical protein